MVMLVETVAKIAFSKGFMFGAPDYFFLQIFTQVVEIIAVPGNPDDQVPVLLRILLSITQLIGANHVKLDVMPIHSEIASYQL